jgi:hypothetical protein
MRNPFARAVCRLAAIAAAAAAFCQYSWMPEHANHLLKTVEMRTETAAGTGGDRAIFTARDNIALLQTITNACALSVDYHLLYAVNDHRPEIYFERGLTYLEQGKLEPATADIALATRFNPGFLESIDAGMQARVAAVNKAVPYNPPPR